MIVCQSLTEVLNSPSEAEVVAQIQRYFFANCDYAG